MSKSITLKRNDFWSNKLNAFESLENSNKITSFSIDPMKIIPILQKVSMATNLSYLRVSTFLLTFCFIMLIAPFIYFLSIYTMGALIFFPLFAYFCSLMLIMAWKNFQNIKLVRRRAQIFLNTERGIENVQFELTTFLDLVIIKNEEMPRESIEEGLITNGGLEIVELFHKPMNVCSGMTGQSKIISTADQHIVSAKTETENEFDRYTQNVLAGGAKFFNPYLWGVVLIILALVVTETFLMIDYYDKRGFLPPYAVVLCIVGDVIGGPLVIYLQAKLPQYMLKDQIDDLKFCLEAISHRNRENGVFVHFKMINNLIAVAKFNRQLTDEDKNSNLFKFLFP